MVFSAYFNTYIYLMSFPMFCAYSSRLNALPDLQHFFRLLHGNRTTIHSFKLNRILVNSMILSHAWVIFIYIY